MVLVVFVHKIRHVVIKSAVEDALADLVTDTNDKMFVMDASEGFAGDFVDFVEMVQVGGSVIFTTVTVAGRVEGREHFAVFGIANIDAAVWGIEGAVAGLASGGNAVKSVATILGADEEIARFGTHAEKMARLILGENLVSELDDIGSFFGFGSVERADAVAINWLLRHELGGFAAKVLEQPALDDGIKILFWPVVLFGFLGEALVFSDIARKPIVRAKHSLANKVFVRRIDGLIESHVDVGADLPLGLHGDFGIHADFVAVDVGFKCDAIVVDFSIGQGKHLEATGIGKGWAVPAGEFGEAAGFFDEFGARGENKVISVGENGLAAEFAHLGMSDGLNGGAGGSANEGWSLNITVRGMDDADAHKASLFDDVEF